MIKLTSAKLRLFRGKFKHLLLILKMGIEERETKVLISYPIIISAIKNKKTLRNNKWDFISNPNNSRKPNIKIKLLILHCY